MDDGNEKKIRDQSKQSRLDKESLVQSSPIDPPEFALCTDDPLLANPQILQPRLSAKLMSCWQEKILN